MSRVSKFKKNARVNLIFYFLTIIAAFFSRKVFLDYLGDDFVGLVSLLQQVLGFLNLAELGISTAISFALYGPLFKEDKKEINAIIIYLGYLYRKIGIFILLGGILISFFIPLFLKETYIPLHIVYFAFFAFLASSLFNYFFNFHITLLQADQKEYVVSKVTLGLGVLKSVVLILIAIYSGNYALWILMEVLFAALIVIVLRKQIPKYYPWLRLKLPKSNSIKKFPDIIIKVRQLVVHKFSFLILTGTDSILVYSFVNLQSVAFYGNYQVILGYIHVLTHKAFGGIQSSIGNLVAEQDDQNTIKVFWEVMALTHFIAGFFFISIYFTIDWFIEVWIGHKYIMSNPIVLVMIINMYIMMVRKPLIDFINAYGLFGDTWSSATQSGLNLILSIVMGYQKGIFGIVLGTAISLGLISLLWKPYFLFRNGFKVRTYKYWSGFASLLIPQIITFFTIKFLVSKYFSIIPKNFLNFFINASILSIIALIVLVLLMLFMNQGFRDLVQRIGVIEKTKNVINKKWFKE